MACPGSSNGNGVCPSPLCSVLAETDLPQLKTVALLRLANMQVETITSPVTLHHLLTHTSGVVRGRTDANADVEPATHAARASIKVWDAGLGLRSQHLKVSCSMKGIEGPLSSLWQALRRTWCQRSELAEGGSGMTLS